MVLRTPLWIRIIAGGLVLMWGLHHCLKVMYQVQVRDQLQEKIIRKKIIRIIIIVTHLEWCTR